MPAQRHQHGQSSSKADPQQWHRNKISATYTFTTIPAIFGGLKRELTPTSGRHSGDWKFQTEKTTALVQSASHLAASHPERSSLCSAALSRNSPHDSDAEAPPDSDWPFGGGAGSSAEEEEESSSTVPNSTQFKFSQLYTFTEALGDDPDSLVPAYVLGSTFMLTKLGPRLDLLPLCMGTFNWKDKFMKQVWAPESFLYGKLVFWASKAAALSARRRQGFESPRKQEEDVQEVTDTAAEVWEADGESAQSQVRSAEVWEAATKEVSKELVARSQDSWRVWKVPSRNPFRRLRLPRWLTREPDGLRDQPLTWRQALLQQSSTTGSTRARLLQMPLVYALNFMGLRGQSEFRFTMCPKADEVIYGQRTERHPLIGARVEKLDELPVFTIPGIWMLMPSTKGFVRFTPHFLSKVELRKAWEAVRRMRMKAIMQARADRRRAIESKAEHAVALWAARASGLDEQGPSGAGPSAEQNEDEPSEIQEFMQELGVQQQASAGPSTASGNPVLVPLRLLGVVACGAAMIGLNGTLQAAAAADKLLLDNPIGRELLLKMPRRPTVVAQPLREVVAEVRRHNAAVLSRPLPREAPHGILDMLLEGFQPGGALSHLDKPQELSGGTATSAQHSGEQQPSDVALGPGELAGTSSPEAAQEPSQSAATPDGPETARTAPKRPAGQPASDAGGNDQASVESGSSSSCAANGRQAEPQGRSDAGSAGGLRATKRGGVDSQAPRLEPESRAALQPSQHTVLVKSAAEIIQRHMARFGLLLYFFELHRPDSTPGLVNSRGGGHQSIDASSCSRQVLPLPRGISFAASRDSLPSRVIAAHGNEEIWADGFPHPDSFIHMPLMSPRERSDSHASGSSLASQQEASRDPPQQPGKPPAAAGTSSQKEPHSGPGTESSAALGTNSSTPEPWSSASGASCGVAADRQADPEGSASPGTSQGGGAEDTARPQAQADSEAGSEASADVDSVLTEIVSQVTDASRRRYHTLWAMNQLCRALADSPEREPHARVAFGRGWQNADVSFLQGLSRAAMMVVSSSVGALLIHTMRANISLRNPFLLVKDHRMHSIWLLRIPHPSLVPDHNSGQYLGPEKYTDSLGDWRYAAFSFDMAEASGMRKRPIAWANSALRGILLIGDLQHDGTGMLPSEAAIGNMNIAGLESQLENWP